MSVTGTGTAQDPYKPTNWNEFVEALAKESPSERKYIDCPKDAVWDMNEQKPIGVDSVKLEMYHVKETRINGNGLTIKNLRGNSSYLFIYEDDMGSIMDRKIYFNAINFLNMYLQGNFICIRPKYENCICFFQGCNFSGISLSKNAIFLSNSDTSYNGQQCLYTFTTSSYNNKGCSFNLVGKDCCLFDGEVSASSGNNQKVQLYFSHIIYDGVSLFTNRISQQYMQNSLIEGFYSSGISPWGFPGSIGSPYLETSACIFDFDTDKSGGKGIYIYNAQQTLVNFDKVAFVTSGAGKSAPKKVTTTQLQDAEYLQSLGFPIGVD